MMEVDGYVVVDHPERAELLEKVSEWLAPTDYAGDGSGYGKHLAAVAPETGEWLLHRNDQFQVWRASSDQNVLWIKGAPGSGKSILAAKVVRHLVEDSAVAFGFLRRIMSTNNTVAFLVRDFIIQLLPHAPGADARVKSLLESSNSDVESVATPELWQLLAFIIRLLPRVTLVVDALDEILPGQEVELLECILGLAESSGGRVKTFITSRPLSHLESLFQDASVGSIRLVGSAIDEDVSRYVSHRLQLQAQRTLSPEDCLLIQSSLAKSLFLQARLTLDEVLKSGKTVAEALQRIPGSLNDLYQSILDQYSSGSQDTAKLQRLVLLWITHSYRPLRLLEIAHVAIFEGLFKNVTIAKSNIRSCCGPLIEIRKDETVHICHHSLAEFLQESRFFASTTEGNHREISMACVCDADAFAKLDRLLAGGGREAIAWIRLSKLDQKLETMGMDRVHFAARFGLTAYVQHLLAQGVNANNQDGNHRTAMMHAVDSGHEETVKLLIAHGVELNAVDKMGLAAVHFAVLSNHPDCLRHIAAAGATITALVSPAGAGGEDVTSPWIFSVSSKQYQLVEDEVCQLLRIQARHLRKRLTASKNMFLGCSAMQLACELGLDGILEVLISFLDPATRASIPLHWAAAGGHATVLKLLLQYPEIKESINSKNHRGNTALFVASRSGSLDAVQTLVEHGADARILNQDRRPDRDLMAKKHKNGGSHWGGLSCLHAWAGMTTLATVWARVSTVDADKSEASRQTRAVELLISYGADPRALNRHGLTALHLMKGQLEELPAIKLLVDAEANINAAQPSTGRTPLHMLFPKCGPLQNTITAIPELALVGADFNRKDNNGNTPLHLATSSLTETNSEEMVEQILGDFLKVCDPTITNGDGHTALFKARGNAFHRQFDKIARRLVESGVDLEARDNEGKTVLLEACRWRDESILGLVKLGADVRARDKVGKTCLHYLFGAQAPNSDFYAYRDFPRIVSTLTNHGAALDAVDNAGNTIFHELAANKGDQHWVSRDLPRWLKTLRDLVDSNQHGAHLRRIASIKNHVGRNPLHSAAAVPPLNSIADDQEVAWCDFFLNPKLGLDPLLPDANGETPLHLAAALSEARAWKLVEAGADISLVSNRGRLPLHEAARGGNINCMALLCQEHQRRQLAIDVKDENGDTPLHEAACSGRCESARLLLDAGADVNAVNCAGLKPAQVAASVSATGLDEKHIRNVVAHVMNHVADEAGALWQYSEEEDLMKDPPFDVTLRELETPGHQAVLRLLTGTAASTGSPTGGPSVTRTEFAYRIPGSRNQPEEVVGNKHEQQAEQEDEHAEAIRELVTAVLTRQHDRIRDLISRTGAEAARCNIFEGHETLVHIVARSGDLETLQAILSLEGDVNSFKPPLLHVAAERKQPNLSIMQYLLSLGANPHAQYKDDRKWRRLRFPSYPSNTNVMHLMSLGHNWWHSHGLRLVTQYGGDLGRSNGEGLTCAALCDEDAANRHHHKQGPYAPLCKATLLTLQQPAEHAAEDLIKLIMDGNADAVRALLESGAADPNRVYHHEDRDYSHQGHTMLLPLQACVDAWDQGVLRTEAGDPAISEIMALLLLHGADAGKLLPGTQTRVFHHAAAFNAPVQPFLDAGVDINLRDPDGATPLIAAAGWVGYMPQGGRELFALDLIGGGADVNAVDDSGQTALHKAARCESHLSNPQVMDALLRAGADAGIRDVEGHDAFYYFLRAEPGSWGMEHYHVGMLGDLWEEGAAAVDVYAETGETNAHVVMRLVAEQFERESIDPDEVKALGDMYRGMVARGADREARDGKGNTPVFELVKGLGNGELPKDPWEAWVRALLVEHVLSAVNDAGDTLLHVLARKPTGAVWSRARTPSAVLFRMLMECGVDPKRENGEGVYGYLGKEFDLNDEIT
ncbi:ankyrin repeat-containing domain protein [Lasiosphaeria miniovina]|uniref:Ankyrin repeat-containing domain protein n=1 Tax=Lasiosphaeria miniovina TaxID=1954250 RepID=A0AA40DYC5_9PEZI|nr:ankyrin repeat-containing domain protein [Lasiosphaeria miniovina]KAK0717516.1 ankyrin repeat-containing domain protein [Lasiosphaeria miniovina]